MAYYLIVRLDFDYHHFTRHESPRRGMEEHAQSLVIPFASCPQNITTYRSDPPTQLRVYISRLFLSLFRPPRISPIRIPLSTTSILCLDGRRFGCPCAIHSTRGQR